MEAGNRNLSLDGVRGVAVLMVVVLHHSLFNFGWVGVDLFFVLSGYLITAIIRKNRTEPAFWRSFWIRRATRILPALLLVLTLTYALTSDLTMKQALLYLLSFGDLLGYTRSHYVALQSLWSLAVEEHFYILWPFAVRYLPRRGLIHLLSALIVIEPCLRALSYLYTHDWRLVYYLTPFRLDGLGLGCLLAILIESDNSKVLLRKWCEPALYAFGSVFILLRVVLGRDFTRDNATPFFNAACYSLVSLMAASIVCSLLLKPQTIMARFFRLRILTFVGTISYGVYLFNVLIGEIVMRYSGIGLKKSILIDLPIVLLFSWLSFKLYEQPITAWGKRRTTLRVLQGNH